VPQACNRHLVAIGVLDGDIPQVAKSVEFVADCLGTLGYSHELPELANLQSDVGLKKKLSLWARSIPREDIVILYFAGHGGTVGKRHYLGLPNTNWEFPDADALASEDLFRVLAGGTVLTNLLVILDTCYSGQAGLDAQGIASSLVDNQSDRAFWLIAASRAKQEAGDGEFAAKFDELIRANRGATIPSYKLHTLVADLNSKLKQFQRANISQIGSSSGELPDFLPNPKFIAEALQGQPIEDRVFFQNDLQQHWKSRAIGSEAIFQSGQWYFTGRTAALQRIISWLNQPDSDGRAISVTGDPGSGKSALLGYLVVASDAEEAQQPALHTYLASMPEGTRPAPGSITFALALRGKTLSEIKEALAQRFQTQSNEVLAAITGRSGRTVLVFDALDESAAPSQIADQLLRPLTGYANLALIVGTRRPEVKNLGSRFDQLDLDLPEYRSDADIAHYVRRLLLAEGETRTTPYRGENASKAQVAADAIAKQASGNYLVARTIARALMERDSVIDLAHERLPRNIPEAFDDFLKQLAARSGMRDWELRDLLVPVAYVYGQGLPLPVWELFTGASVSPVLDLAAAFIAEFAEDGRSVYRLYHQALADALRDPKRDAIRQQRMAQALYNALPHADWSRADWFTRKYFADYSAAGDPDLLERAVLDVTFLAAANTPRLVAAATGVQSAEAKRRLNWLRLTSDRLNEGDDGDHVAQFELVAKQNGASDLAAECEHLNIRRRWRPKWANWSEKCTPHRTLRGHTNSVNSVAISDGIVVSGSDDYTVRFWNAATGETVGLPAKHDNKVTAVAASHELAMSGGWDDTVRFWDLKSGKSACQPLTGHKGRVLAVALGDGFAASGDSSGTIIVWDLSTFKMLGGPRKSYRAAVNAIRVVGDLIISGSSDGKLEIWNRYVPKGTELLQTHWKNIATLTVSNGTIAVLGDNRTFGCFDFKGRTLGDPIPLNSLVTSFALADDVLVCACVDFSVRLVNPKTGDLLGTPLAGHNSFVQCVAIDGNTIVSGGGDNTVRIWDRSLMEPLGSNNPNLAGAAAQVAIAGPFVTIAHWDRTLSIWDLHSGERLNKSEQSIHVLNREHRTIAANKNSLLAFIAEDGRLFIKDLTTQVDTPVTELDLEPSVLDLSDDFLVALSQKGNTLHCWSLTPPKSLNPIISKRQIYSALAIKENLLWAIVENTMCRWNLITGESVGTPVPGATETSVLAVSSKWIVSGHWSGILKVWDKSTADLLRVSDIGKRSSRLTCLALFEDFAISSGPDETVFVWNLNTLEMLFKIQVGSPVNGISAYNTGVCLACALGILCIELNL
jgi:WD40 repeat protein